MENLTFESLPKAVQQLFHKLEIIEKLLNEQKDNVTPTETMEQLLNVQETAKFLNLSKATIYSKVSRGELPVMKRSKRLYFSKDELMNYLKLGRKKSNLEIEEEAKNFCNNKKGLNNGF